MATAIALTPDLPDRWRQGQEATEPIRRVTWSDKTLASAAGMALVRHQMRRVTRGKHPTGRTHPVHALICDQLAQRRALRSYRDWLQSRRRTTTETLLESQSRSQTGRLGPGNVP